MKKLDWIAMLLSFSLFTGHLKGQAVIYWEEFNGGPNSWVSQVISPLDSSYWPWYDNKWQWTESGDISSGALYNPAYPSAINSESAENGAMVFNADFYTTEGDISNIPPGPPYVPFYCHLISPPIDLSGISFPLQLQFNQYLRFLNSTVGAPGGMRAYVSWSVNGGNTWSSPQDVGADQAPLQYGQSDAIINVLMPNVQNVSNFRLRFSWSSDLFFWVIDDVKIVGLPPNDMRVSSDWFAVAPNLFWPLPMSEHFSFLSNIENAGSQIQTDVSLNMEIEDEENNSVYSQDLYYGSVAPGVTVENQPFSGVGFLPTDLGFHTATYSVSASTPDDIPENNNQTFSFVMTDTLYAKEAGVTQPVRPASGNWSPEEPWSWAYGNYFHVPQAGIYQFNNVIFSMQAPAELEGEQLKLRIYKWNDANQNDLADPPERIHIATLFYTIAGNETTENLITVPIQNSFGGKIPLENNTGYIVMVEFQTNIVGYTISLGGSSDINYAAMVLRSMIAGSPRYASLLGINGNLDNVPYSTLGFGYDLVPVVRLSIVLPTPVAALNASQTCGYSSFTVNFTDLSSNEPTYWFWDFGNGETSDEQNPTVNYDGGGTYTVSLIVGNAGGSDTLVLENFITVASPVALTTYPGDTICSGSAVVLMASGAETYNWMGAGLVSNFGSSVSAIPANPGNYQYTVTGSVNGCPSPPQQVSITALPLPTPIIIIEENSGVFAGDGTICEGHSASLAVGNYNSYQWAPGGETTQDISLTPNSTINYSVTVTDDNGCSGTNSQVISVIPYQQITAFMSPDSLCLGDTLVLTASGADQYLWSGPELFDFDGSEVMAMPTQTGAVTYQVSGQTGGCPAETVTITGEVLPIIPHTASISMSNCPGPHLLFSVQVQNGGAFPHLHWFVNGRLAGIGDEFTLFYAKNGDEVFCTSTIAEPLPCVFPIVAQSNLIMVECIEEQEGCWEQVSAGLNNHTVAIMSDGTLWAWGGNDNGQLGDGTNADKLTPIQIGTHSDWKQVSAGFNHTLAIKNDGTLWAWGNNSHGEYGDGTYTSKNYPIQIGPNNDWTKVVAGKYYSLGIRGNENLFAWGDNGYGQLGDGTNVSKNSPVFIGTAPHLKEAVAGEKSFSIALNSYGGTFTWGSNISGQLGTGNYNSQYTPIQVLSFVTQISGGGGHTVCIRADRALWAWGSNQSGQLGDGTFTSTNFPNKIGTDNDWLWIEAGDYHTSALKIDGTLWAWGSNEFGNLGDGSTTDKKYPGQIGDDTDWKEIDTGNSHVMAIKADGSLWAWGRNHFGQLGTGALSDVHSPVQIGCPTSAAREKPMTSSSFRVSPNPAKDYITLHFTNPVKQNFKIEIWNTLGGMVLGPLDLIDNQKIDVSILTQGMYFISIFGNRERALLPFVKMK